MVRILISFLVALPAFGTVTITSDQLTPVSVRVNATITAAGNIRAVYEPRTAGACRSANQLAYASMSVWRANAGLAQRTIAGLKPGTEYCIAGWNTNTGEYSTVETIQTPGLNVERPEPPKPVNSWVVEGMPAITGNTYTVAANCSDLQSKINQAAAAPGSANHQILIPAGAVCTAEYFMFPPRVGTGWIVMRTAAPDAQLPPEGVRLTPAWAPRLATLQVTGKIYASGAHAAIRMTDDSSKWRFVGLEITHPAVCANCVGIASVTPGNPTTIVTATPHGLASGLLIRAFGVNGIAGLDKTTRISVVNPTTISIPAATTGSYTGGGRLIANTNAEQDFKTLAFVSEGSQDIIFDRCWVHGRGFPDRIHYGMLIRGRRVSIINSTVERVRHWHLVEPGTNNLQFGSYVTNLLIDFTGAKQFLLENNYLEPIGVGLFSQEAYTRITEDVILRRNHIVVPNEVRYRSMGDNPASDGHYYIHRMPLEFKQGKRVLVEGNLFEGQYMDNSPPGPSVLFYLRGSLQGGDGPNTVQDIQVVDNVFRNTSGAIQIVGEDDNAAQGSLATRRVLLKNNLMYNINAGLYKTSVTTSSGDRGFCFWLMRSIHDLQVDHNTCWDPRGSGPMSFLFGHNRSGYMRLSNNILSWNTDSNIGGFFYDDNGAAPLPAPTPGLASAASFRQIMDGNWQQLPDPAWSMHDNLIVPGVRNMGASIDSTNLGDQWNRYSLCDSANGVLKDVLGSKNYCAGSNTANTGAETVRQRMNSVGFRSWSSGDFRLLPQSVYSAAGTRRASDGLSLGADPERIEQKQGVVSNVRVRNLGTASATISYQAPDAVACTVEYGTSNVLGTGVRVSDGGGSRARNVDLAGLASGTSYFYRVLCAAQQPSGDFLTR